MPFLPPNQQFQSTEGKKLKLKPETNHCNQNEYENQTKLKNQNHNNSA